MISAPLIQLYCIIFMGLGEDNWRMRLWDGEECAISPVHVVTCPDRAGKHPTNGSLIISIQIGGRREEVFLLTHAQQQVMFTEPEGIGVRTRDKESNREPRE